MRARSDAPLPSRCPSSRHPPPSCAYTHPSPTALPPPPSSHHSPATLHPLRAAPRHAPQYAQTLSGLRDRLERGMITRVDSLGYARESNITADDLAEAGKGLFQVVTTYLVWTQLFYPNFGPS